jgi:hypothetical protein
MNTENLSTLKIHKLTQDQYNRIVEDGTIDENALYLTPDEMTDVPQSDWGQDDPNAIDYIKNKPTADDALDVLAMVGMIVPIVSDDNYILTDDNNIIYSL